MLHVIYVVVHAMKTFVYQVPRSISAVNALPLSMSFTFANAKNVECRCSIHLGKSGKQLNNSLRYLYTATW